MLSKSYYRDHGEEIKKEVDEYKAHSESKNVSFERCNHKNAKMVGQELRCLCGSAWQGARISELLDNLRS